MATPATLDENNTLAWDEQPHHEPSLQQYFEKVNDESHHQISADESADTGNWANFSSADDNNSFGFFESSSLFRMTPAPETVPTSKNQICDSKNHEEKYEDVDDDDCNNKDPVDDWIDQLFPQRHPQPSGDGGTSSFYGPRHQAHCRGIRQSRREGTTFDYQLRYQAANTTHSSTFAEEHISNEEWSTLRRRRERWLRQHQFQDQNTHYQATPSPLSTATSSSLPPTPNSETRSERRERRRRLIASSDIGISPTGHSRFGPDYTTQAELDYDLLLQERQLQHDIQASSTGATPTILPAPLPPVRVGARRLPVTSEARRQQWSHRSVSALQASWRLARYPFRWLWTTTTTVVTRRGLRRSVHRETTDNHSLSHFVSDDDEISIGEISSGYPDLYFHDSNASERQWELPDSVDYDDDYDNSSILDGDDDNDDQTTGYWSTSTAPETRYGSDDDEFSLVCVRIRD